MKTLDSIPTGKIQRASKLISTGAKVGINYLKYNVEKTVGNVSKAKENLDKANATDIYDSLKDLKGSALKVAQMLSMEKSMLPKAYVEKFSLSQFSVPPLSSALVLKTFRKYFGKSPNEIYDEFDLNSINAASIGQVHKATLDGKTLAVKIQYPGVAQSISSDLALVKPIAMRMFNIKGEGSDKYFKEVENKLTEETNYILEVAQSIAISNACKKIPNLKFPNYYSDLSTDRIITMDWMEGVHLSEYDINSASEEIRTKIGQALWDFYMYQIHVLKKVHADPHPGNFLISKDNQLIALDFGCMKEIPDSFYIPYFELADPKVINNQTLFKEKLYELEILIPQDSPKEIKFFTQLFYELLSLFTQPFHVDTFDFSDDLFFGKIAELGERFNNDSELKNMNGNRGSKHFIYINRTFFGLYNLMHDLKSKNIKINNYKSI
ncbi:putative unusual protein kinase regulating ubiquinone biosynthesis (AarF/ABC1/UbiB family) [Wenyingzhuangia heitensis]|uniref:Unusual protein kinase regulating ubiquinone biosynthesis (AarF/ABC1/UbiB family) n=1 Tax=Wenyingzhuangia heitensis TaxID=1487859 RepID=A0ABX0UC85_9FLAO|nr:lipopolysaccharide core heptose(II) kinase RfaY [Wenyingzhuangia heitensis]NIJ44761.1 putative unusual protein kinase regulating ubiquinone biosynthesis (AarF/ABC1/UbiB family) [Wenyingzhuangia heitensis]